MEVAQARAYLAVAEHLHFGRAAQQLNMGQAPLSRLISQLERSLGVQLFERTTRSVLLAPAGQALLDPARNLVEASDVARGTVKSTVSGETGKVRIGFAGASTGDRVGQLARALRRTHSGLALEFHSSQFSHIGLDRVLDGSLDIAIGRWDFLPAEVDSRLLVVEQILIALPESHPLAKREDLELSELASEGWINLPGGFSGALQNRMNSLAIASGFVPRIVQTAPDSWTLVALVGAEMGIAMSLDSIRDNILCNGVDFVPLRSGNTALEVSMIWRRNEPSPAVQNVLAVAERIFPHPRGRAEA